MGWVVVEIPPVFFHQNIVPQQIGSLITNHVLRCFFERYPWSLILHHWNSKVPMMTTLSSLVAPKVVIMANDIKVTSKLASWKLWCFSDSVKVYFDPTEIKFMSNKSKLFERQTSTCQRFHYILQKYETFNRITNRWYNFKIFLMYVSQIISEQHFY